MATSSATTPVVTGTRRTGLCNDGDQDGDRGKLAGLQTTLREQKWPNGHKRTDRVGQVFYDNFHRADGALLNGWNVWSGSVVIAGNRAHSTGGGGRADRTGELSATSQRVWVTVDPTSTFPGVALLEVRQTDPSRRRFEGKYTLAAGTIGVDLVEIEAGTVTRATTANIPIPSAGAVLGLTVDGTAVTATINGAVVALITSQLNPTGLNYGFGGDNAGIYFSDFGADQLTTPALTVSAVENALVPGQWTVSLSGGNGNWTPGSPGLPIFVFSQGTVVSQEVTGPSTAEVEWRPLDYVTDLVVRDPVNGIIGSLEVGVGLVPGGGGGGGGGDFTEDAVTNLTNLAAEYAANNPWTGIDYWKSTLDFLAKWAPGGAYPPDNFGTLLLSIYNDTAEGPGDLDRLYDLAKYASTDAAASYAGILNLQSNVTALQTDVDEIRGPDNWALMTVRNNICGLGQPTIADVLTAIAGISEPDLSSITEYLDWITETKTYGLGYLADELASIRTNNGYTLGSVIGQILSARGAGLPTIADVLANLPPDRDWTAQFNSILAKLPIGTDHLHTHLEGISADLSADTGLIRGDIGSAEAAILAAIAAISLNVDLQPVLDAIAALDSKLDAILAAIEGLAGSTRQTPAYYPGPAGVNFSDPVPFVGSTSITQPMDGALCEIVSTPSGIGGAGAGGHVWYYRTGRYGFLSPDGYLEPWTYLDCNKGILVPQRMVRAGGIVLSCPSDVSGTVTPWSLKV